MPKVVRGFGVLVLTVVSGKTDDSLLGYFCLLVDGLIILRVVFDEETVRSEVLKAVKLLQINYRKVPVVPTTGHEVVRNITTKNRIKTVLKPLYDNIVSVRFNR